jgi:hypothetical protein
MLNAIYIVPGMKGFLSARENRSSGIVARMFLHVKRYKRTDRWARFGVGVIRYWILLKPVNVSI